MSIKQGSRLYEPGINREGTCNVPLCRKYIMEFYYQSYFSRFGKKYNLSMYLKVDSRRFSSCINFEFSDVFRVATEAQNNMIQSHY